MRKLVTIRTINNFKDIPGRDRIILGFVDGWSIIIPVGMFTAGDKCVFFEPDAFLPDGDERWQFLVDKKPKEYGGVRGHVLKTMKMHGATSNGFVLPLSKFSEFGANPAAIDEAGELIDYSAMLGVIKYDPPEDLNNTARTKGGWPAFLQKSDETRCQNLVSSIFEWGETTYEYTTSVGDVIRVTKTPKNTKDTLYEVTMKLDGSSYTAYNLDDERKGLCSRNLEIDVTDVTSNAAVLYNKLHLGELIPKGFAFQMEFCGPKVQGNQEKLSVHQFYLFKIFDIMSGTFVPPQVRHEMYASIQRSIRELVNAGEISEQDAGRFNHVPVLQSKNLESGEEFWLYGGDMTTAKQVFIKGVYPQCPMFTLDRLGIANVADMLKFADGPSVNAKLREGIVFNRQDGGFSFKSISEEWKIKN